MWAKNFASSNKLQFVEEHTRIQWINTTKYLGEEKKDKLGKESSLEENENNGKIG